MAGWADYSFPNIYLAPSSIPANGMIAALNERHSVFGLSAISELLPLRPYSSLSPKSWSVSFEAALNETIPYYVNHTINGGDFTGLDGFPMWTKESIYEYLGETCIDPSYTLLAPNFYSAWALQKYRVINLLRWIKYNWGDLDNIISDSEIIDDTLSMTWEESVSSFRLFNWRKLEIAVGSYSAIRNDEFIGGRYVIRAERGYFNIGDNLFFLYDHYSYPSRVSSEVNDFQPLIGATIENKLNLMKSFSQESNIFSFWDLEEESFPSLIIPDSNLKTVYNGVYGASISPEDTTRGIKKYSNPNGFKFRGEDW